MWGGASQRSSLSLGIIPPSQTYPRSRAGGRGKGWPGRKGPKRGGQGSCSSSRASQYQERVAVNVPNRFQLPWLEASQEKPAPHFPFPKGGRLGDFYFLKRRRGVRGAAKLRVILSLSLSPNAGPTTLGGIASSHLFSYQRPGREGDPSSRGLPHIRTGAGRALRSVIKPEGRD